MYSTCSISNTQNDAVVQAACEQYMSAASGRSESGKQTEQELQHGSGKQDHIVTVLPLGKLGVGSEQIHAWGVETTRLGMICLPDTAGCGPIYVAVLEKQ